MYDINILKQLIKGGDPQKLYEQMMKDNPKFSQFVSECAGKTPEEIARSYGIDPALLNIFKE